MPLVSGKSITRAPQTDARIPVAQEKGVTVPGTHSAPSWPPARSGSRCAHYLDSSRPAAALWSPCPAFLCHDFTGSQPSSNSRQFHHSCALGIHPFIHSFHNLLRTYQVPNTPRSPHLLLHREHRSHQQGVPQPPFTAPCPSPSRFHHVTPKTRAHICPRASPGVFVGSTL